MALRQRILLTCCSAVIPSLSRAPASLQYIKRFDSCSSPHTNLKIPSRISMHNKYCALLCAGTRSRSGLLTQTSLHIINLSRRRRITDKYMWSGCDKRFNATAKRKLENTLLKGFSPFFGIKSSDFFQNASERKINAYFNIERP